MIRSHNLDATLEWIDTVGNDPVTTLARLAITLDELPIWPVWGDDETNLDVFVDDLLSYLTANWDTLLLQQVYPDGLEPGTPSALVAAAQAAVANGPRNSLSEELVSGALTFARTHDFSQCFGGLYDLPALWIVRQGADMLIETANRVERVPIENWLRFATKLGDGIAQRLIATDPSKWQKLVHAWRARDLRDPARIASLSTGHPIEIARKLIAEDLVPNTNSVLDAANDNDGLRIAARMVGAIPYQAIKVVLTAAKSIPHKPSAKLDALRLELGNEMAILPESAFPYEQGVHAANWVRSYFGIDENAQIDPLDILHQCEVGTSIQVCGPATLDALAIWGDAHGPAVIFNSASKKLAGVKGIANGRRLRVSAAHELCHLILDYRRTLAAVDILGSRIPLDAERRANAFAAEFLLPARTAASFWRQSELNESYDGVSKILRRLSERFNVSRTVAGWQLDHGLNGTNPEIVFLLDELLDRR